MDKPVRKIDHMMWDVELPTSLVTITGMMTFKKKVNVKKLHEVLTERLLKYERFHKKIVMKKDQPMWQMDEAFHLKGHVFHSTLGGKGDYEALRKKISELMSNPLDYSRPLWDVHIIDNYNGGSTVVWRIHHAIADGIALIKVVFSLTGTSAKESLNHSLGAYAPKAPKKHGLLEDIGHLFHTGENIFHEAQHLLQHPETLKDALDHTWKAAKEIGALFGSKEITGSLYKGNLSLKKKTAWATAFDLDVIKAAGKAHQATVNDVLLALLSGAIRRHLLLHKQDVSEGLRVVVPVNVRGHHDDIILHNEIGMLSLELPVHLKTFKQRLPYIKAKTALLKNSIEPMLVNKVMEVVADYLPKPAKQKFAEIMGSKIAGVITNVPGPRHPVYLAGSKVSDLVCWIPHTAPLGIGISLLSYNSNVSVGVVIDQNRVKDPDAITIGFKREFLQLTKQIKAKKAKA